LVKRAAPEAMAELILVVVVVVVNRYRLLAAMADPGSLW
jgi:hypothetical protein